MSDSTERFRLTSKGIPIVEIKWFYHNEISHTGKMTSFQLLSDCLDIHAFKQTIWKQCQYTHTFKTAIFNLGLLICIFTSSNVNPLRWMPWDLTDDKSTLVQVMAWCRQATSHYLSQCWPSSMSPYGVTRPQCVLIMICLMYFRKK